MEMLARATSGSRSTSATSAKHLCFGYKRQNGGFVICSQNTSVLATNNKMVVLSHPCYLPDLTPCDFISFSEMKRDMLADVAEV
jgi:hypothetical protein